MRKDVARDRDRIVLVILSVVAGHFDVQQSVWIFAEDYGEICVTSIFRIKSLKIAAQGKTGNEFRTVHRISWRDNSGLQSDLKHRCAVTHRTSFENLVTDRSVRVRDYLFHQIGRYQRTGVSNLRGIGRVRRSVTTAVGGGLRLLR